ncbi:MAG: hypothetical protein ACI8XB_000074 [Patiriisocius sp.]|jgi:hypothetical protein
MNIKLNKLIALAFIAFSAFQFKAQCDEVNTRCLSHLGENFISDGQNYRALLVEDEVAEFTTTFYAGIEYRLAACSGKTDGILEFRVYDQNRKLLFDNTVYNDSPYWNFKTESNMDCIIEASLNEDQAESGCAVILLGFKN